MATRLSPVQRPPAPRTPGAIASASTDRYLAALYLLAFPIGEERPELGGPVAAARVAEVLGISRAAVSEMLGRLERERLIRRDERRKLVLTANGLARAERVVRRRRTIECFLTDFLGYQPVEAQARAATLGDALDDELVERMHERIGSPERCPHGWPLDPAAERAENSTLTRLAELAPGRDAEVARLARHPREVVDWLHREGFVPGARVTVVEAVPAAGLIEVELDGERQRLGESAARGVYVRRP